MVTRTSKLLFRECFLSFLFLAMHFAMTSILQRIENLDSLRLKIRLESCTICLLRNDLMREKCVATVRGVISSTHGSQKIHVIAKLDYYDVQ